MIETFSSLASAFGLSTSAGLNAYLPLLVVAIAARYTDLIKLNEPWDAITSNWAIAIIVILLFIELTVDKIPAVDTMNDMLQTVGRPLAGAILFAGSSGVVGELHPAIAFGSGLLLAGGVHAAKTAARPVVTATTGGMGNWLVSLIEDIVSFVTAILAILLPILIMIAIVIVMFVFARRFSRRKPKTLPAG